MTTEATEATGANGSAPAMDGANQAQLTDGGQPQNQPASEPSATLATGNPAESAPAPIPEYTDFTFPEGIEINNELLGEFKDVAKTLGLKQEQAQMLADFGPKMAQTIVSKIEIAKQAEFDSWAESTKNDKDIGGDKLNENLALAKRTLGAFGSDELNQIIDKTGIGNHPAFIKILVAIGKQISDDRLVSGSPKPTEGKNWYDTLYS